MRHCFNEKVDYYEAVGSDLPALLEDAAQTLRTIEEYVWADLKVQWVGDHPTFDADFLVSMDVH